MHCVSVWRLRAKSQARLPFGNAGARRKTLEMLKREVLLALGAAGLVNMAMSAMAAVAFHNGAHHQTAEIETAYQTLAPLLGAGAAGLFMLALLASGFSSSVVGVTAGRVIMQGFVSFRIPFWFRRLVVMMPWFAVISAGIDITYCSGAEPSGFEPRSANPRWWLLSGSPPSAM